MADGGLIEILFYAALAGFVLMHLRRVLGRRTGHERRPPPPDSFGDSRSETGKPEGRPANDGEEDNVIPLPGRDRAESEPVTVDQESLPAGITRIKIADDSFDEAEFLRGARMAFEMIVQAYAAGDREALKPLLAAPLHRSFVTAIYERERERETQETTIVTFRSSDIIEAELNNSVADVTVEFVTDQVKVTRDIDGNVVDGDPDRIETLTDIWTFRRDLAISDPNWELVATRVPEDE